PGPDYDRCLREEEAEGGLRRCSSSSSPGGDPASGRFPREEVAVERPSVGVIRERPAGSKALEALRWVRASNGPGEAEPEEQRRKVVPGESEERRKAPVRPVGRSRSATRDVAEGPLAVA
ncbi:MAG: hypothetical protein ACLP8Y_00170, partial [Thermoplasmata archaeon]